jgi:hypothetical protein
MLSYFLNAFLIKKRRGSIYLFKYLLRGTTMHPQQNNSHKPEESGEQRDIREEAKDLLRLLDSLIDSLPNEKYAVLIRGFQDIRDLSDLKNPSTLATLSRETLEDLENDIFEQIRENVDLNDLNQITIPNRWTHDLLKKMNKARRLP